MCKELIAAKNDLIKKYFQNNEVMKDVVERAYNGEGCCQSCLADWLEKNGHSEEAKIWKDMAKTYYEQKEE